MTIANLLVGNAPKAAALEITLGQVDVQFTRTAGSR
jgi:allophanate hydrolase subunit 2